MNCLIQSLKMLDNLSFAPCLFTDGRRRHQSVTGGITQILLIMLYIGGIVYFSQDIYYRLNPSVLESSSIELNPGGWNLTASDFNFMVSLNDPITYATYINESIYTVEIYQNHISKGALIQNELLPVGKCSLDNFVGVDHSIFQPGYQFDTFYCISPSYKVKMQGSLSSDEFVYIQVKVKQCDTTDKTKNCAPQSEIDAKLNGCALYVNYLDKYFDPSDYTSPTKYYIKTFLTTVSNTFYSAFILYLKKVDFIDDVGFIFESTNTKSELAVYGIEKNLDFRRNPHFAEFIFVLGQNVTNLNRKYKRIQEIIAQVGGLMNVLNIIIGTIISYFSRNNYLYSVYNKNFKNINKDEMVSIHPHHSVLPLSTSNNVNIIRGYDDTKLEKSATQISKADENKKMELIMKIADTNFLIKITKEIELFKVLLLDKSNLALFERFIDHSSGSNLLFFDKQSMMRNREGDNLNVQYETKLRKLNSLLI